MSIPILAFLLYSTSIIMPFILTAYLNKKVLPLHSKRGKSGLVRTTQNQNSSNDQAPFFVRTLR